MAFFIQLMYVLKGMGDFEYRGSSVSESHRKRTEAYNGAVETHP
jgi:hypothetical protein